ncbi:biotin/lipoyl-containing protein [uncultured Oscillibacter sp.]|uniref:biotin/lipoyl-containing protein n=1 Tax=uncultured Oscillibacter sp. TaxID=876091 RepID=UPI0028045036|nr:biotin/lipoyl-containing protein [uncultured Oscillibacter sp.]
MEIKARIPGTILSVSAAVGDEVKARAVLGTLEAMKMEQPIACPVDGTVKAVHIQAGDKVKTGAVLFVVE